MKENKDEKLKKPGTSQEKFIKIEQQCEYCGNFFYPKRRFVQKYCSSSCRVMAYNYPERKYCKDKLEDLPENQEKQDEADSALKEKQNNIVEIKKAVKEIVEDAIKDVIKENKQDFLKTISRNTKTVNSKISKIIERQEYHMLISSLMPLIAEPLRHYFIRIFNPDQPPKNLEEFMQQMEPVSKDIAPVLKVKIYEVASAFFDEKSKEDNG